jgi:CO dehydrogenase/acetyl-CoA synthase alpha subunit
MRKIIYFTIFIVILANSVFGQQPSASPTVNELTNDSIIEMVEAKIPDSVIISKIEVSKARFKTEVADLKTLTEKGVSEAVISAMVKKSADVPKPQKEVEYTNNNPEYGNLSEIAGKTNVCLRVTDVKSREIIVKALNKQQNYRIWDNRKDCDFGIWFASESRNVGSNVLLGTVNNIVVVGRMIVYTWLPVNEGETVGRIRILWQKDKTQDFSGGLTFDKHPANSINDFLKAHKKLDK